MAIQFFGTQHFVKVLKVTIQKTGRLGFTSQTAEAMSLDSDSYFLFGKDEEHADTLIMVKVKKEVDGAFRAIKSGAYYYLSTTPLFDFLEYNYKKEPIIFDVRREPKMDAEAGGEVYLLKQRASKGRRVAAKKEKAQTEPEQFQLDIPEE